jgi:hypothetical protein
VGVADVEPDLADRLLEFDAQDLAGWPMAGRVGAAAGAGAGALRVEACGIRLAMLGFCAVCWTPRRASKSPLGWRSSGVTFSIAGFV